MKNQKLLPIGSVVYLNEGIIPLMIIARQPIVNINKDKCYMDYAAINQLTGLVSMEEFAYFNQEDISDVLYEGFVGENEERVLSALKEWREKNKNISKGKVSEIIEK
jgi:hypothetical protein